MDTTNKKGRRGGEPAGRRKATAGDCTPAAGDSQQNYGDGKPSAASMDPATEANLILDGLTRDGVPTLRFWRGAWWVWSAGRYRELPAAEARAVVVRSLNDRFSQVNRHVVSDVLDQLRALAILPGRMEPPAWLAGPRPWPADELLIARNAVVHLPTLVSGDEHLAEPTPRLFSTVALDYDFDADAPPPVAWLRFLTELWPDDADAISTLREWFGYCLVQDTRLQKLLLLVGPKRSGKGTIARVLRAMIGAANVAGPTLASLSQNFGLQPLIGKSLAIVADARLSGKTDQAVVVERLLSVSGEDCLTIDRKYQEPWTGKLPTRFAILSNELPRLSDSSGALVGRMILLRLTQSFFGREDTDLTAKLLAELPSILLWSIDGWRRLRERGRFSQPQSALEMLDDMSDLASPVGHFVRDCCVVDPACIVAVADLYGAWRAWCDRHGRREPGTEQIFGRDLLAAVPTLRRTQPRDGDSRYRAYAGLRLRGDA